MTTSAFDTPVSYRFADLTLDVARRLVARAGKPIELKALDFDLLRFLVEQAPNVVGADVLAENVWGRHFVSPENVAQRVMLLRQSLGDDAGKPRYIETVRNKGYRLLPVVERVAAEPAHPPSPPPRRWRAAAISAVLLAGGLAALAAYWLTETDEPMRAASSVAVVPLDNSSPAVADAYFGAAMQDEIVSQLTKVDGLSVVPVRPAGAADVSIPDIVRRLNVATTLGGSVYYAEGRVRVVLRLTDTATGVSLWSDSYDRELRDIFAVQSEIALDVAHALRLELSANERERIERSPTTNSRARDLYLSATARQYRDTPEEALRAIAEIEEALSLDPAFTQAWIIASNLRTTAQFYDPGHAEEHRNRGADAARRALAIDPDNGHAHGMLGYALSLTRDWRGAEAAYRKARTLNVPLSEMAAYGVLQLAVRNFAFAREIFEQNRLAQPYNPTSHRFLMLAHTGLGDWATATELYESGMRVFVPWRDGPNQRMHALVGRNEVDGARAVPIDDPLNTAMLERLDTPEEALAELRRVHAAHGSGNPGRSRDIALWAAHFGDTALALEAMRAAIDEQGGQMVYVWLPQLAAMRQVPEFKAYLREIGMVAYWQEYGWPSSCRPLDGEDFQCD